MRPEVWRVDQIARDFKRIDDWGFAIAADPAKGETFSQFIAMVTAIGPSTDSRVTLALIRIREVCGRAFGWDEDSHIAPIPGCRETSVAERLTEGDRAKNQAALLVLPHQQLVNLRAIYLFESEALFELNNRTIHALLHFAWVAVPGNRYTPRLGVYVKSRGPFSDVYMTLIWPFRHWIVYPAWTKKVAREWRKAHRR